MNESELTQLAARQLADYDAGEPGTSFRKLQLSLPEAYQVQSRVAELREQRGEHFIGYKVGCTSPTIRRQLNIDHPVFGRLFDSDSWPSGTVLPASRFCRLAIEGELAVRLGQEVPSPNGSPETIASAVEAVFPVIELHNLIFRREAPSSAELIANNAIHAGFVYDDSTSRSFDLEAATLDIRIDGKPQAQVSGRELANTVVQSLKWLAAELHGHALFLQPGQTILCGSVADLFPVPSQCSIVASTDRYGSVACTVQET